MLKCIHCWWYFYHSSYIHFVKTCHHVTEENIVHLSTEKVYPEHRGFKSLKIRNFYIYRMSSMSSCHCRGSRINIMLPWNGCVQLNLNNFLLWNEYISYINGLDNRRILSMSCLCFEKVLKLYIFSLAQVLILFDLSKSYQFQQKRIKKDQ